MNNPVKDPIAKGYVDELDGAVASLQQTLNTVSELAKEAALEATEKSKAARNQYRLVIIIGALVIIVVGFGPGLYSTARISKNIHELVKTTQAIAEGNLDKKVEFKSNDELGLLATCFNKMTENLKKSQLELRNLNEQLEREVEKRTSELKVLSITDNLTGLYNQRYFYKKLEDEAHRAVRQNTGLFVLLLDIDKFKQFNDGYGHLAGDRLLEDIGQTIKDSIRQGVDAAFRYGGDEFTVLIPGTTEEQAIEVANRIKANLNNIDILVSMGLSLCIQAAENSKSFIKQADLAMYAAKRAGGNRICTYREYINTRPAV